LRVKVSVVSVRFGARVILTLTLTLTLTPILTLSGVCAEPFFLGAKYPLGFVYGYADQTQ